MNRRFEYESTFFHYELDAIPPHYKENGRAFTAMVYLINSQTFVCRTVDASLFVLNEFSDSSDTNYSSDDEDDFHGEPSSVIRKKDTDSAYLHGKKKDIDKKKHMHTHVPEYSNKFKEQKQRIVDNVKLKISNAINTVEDNIIQSAKWLRSKTYWFAAILFTICSLLIVGIMIFKIQKQLGEMENIRLRSFYVQIVVLLVFLTYVFLTFLKLVYRKEDILKYIYVGVLRFHSLLYLQIYIILIAYICRIAIEIFIKREVIVFKEVYTLYYSLTIIGIFLFSIYVSNKPQNIVYFACWKHFVLTFAFTDRALVVPELVRTTKFIYSKIYEGFFDQYWIRQFFSTHDSSLFLMAALTFETIALGTAITFLHYQLIAIRSSNENIMETDYGTHSTTIVTWIQGIAILLNPILAVFLSLPVMDILTENEQHAVLTAILAAPTVNVSSTFMENKIYTKEMLTLLITYPAVKIICSFTAPMPPKHGHFLLSLDLADPLMLKKSRGLRCAFFFNSKIISLIAAITFSTSVTIEMFYIVVSWLMYNILRIDPALCQPVNIIAIIFMPVITTLGFVGDDVKAVSVMFAESLVYGPLTARNHSMNMINTIVLTDCLRRVSSTIPFQMVRATGYRTYSNTKSNQSVTLPLPMEGKSASMLIYLLFHNLSISSIFIVYALYAILVPQTRKKLNLVMFRAILSAILSIFLVTVIGGLFYYPSKPFICVIPNRSQFATCLGLIHQKNAVKGCDELLGTLY